MAYDEKLAGRVRKVLGRRKGFSEKKMFGGICCLLNGNMACGVLEKELIVRIGVENTAALLIRKNTRAFAFTGKKMNGFVVVNPAGLRAAADLKRWVALGANYAQKLPKKK